MTKHASKIAGRTTALALLAMTMAPVAASASDHRESSDNAAENERIHPVPGDKSCLHHIAQYDDEGNFVGYKTERGPCR